MTNTISMDQVKNLINYTIDNNNKLQEDGKTPIAIALEASAGIGKTSVVKQVAEERNMGFTKLNLAQLDEAGDLIGFPVTEYECQIAKRFKDEDGNIKTKVLPGTVWLTAKQLDTMDKNTAVKQTGKTRMGYAKPAWVPEYNENGTICLLDDYVRASPQLLQACMDLILEQKYVSWSLPEKTTIVLTNNADDGSNNVSSLDEAQRTRFLNFDVAFDTNAWMEWAENAGIDGRCINFVASYSDELFSADEEGNRICNPRSFVMFANMISGINDWDNQENLAFISTIAKGCFKDEGSKFSSMFTAFIRNKMHLLIQPKEILLGSWSTVKDKLEATLYDTNGSYRPDLASLLERRFSNFVGAWLDSKEQTPIAKVKDRILDFMDNQNRLFTQDLFFHMVKTITAKHKNQTNKLLFEPRIAKLLAE